MVIRTTTKGLIEGVIAHSETEQDDALFPDHPHQIGPGTEKALYRYSITELSSMNNEFSERLQEVVTVESLPEGTVYIRPAEEALEYAYERLELEKYDNDPKLVVNELWPDEDDSEDEKRLLVVRIGKYDDSSQVDDVLEIIFTLLSRGEFGSLAWEERKYRLKESLPDPVGVAGSTASVISLL